eukprot:scaffold207_cov267-Pinguiococcus_pyrenoidosus.AAC.8
MSRPTHFVPIPSNGVGSLDDSDLLVPRERSGEGASAVPAAMKGLSEALARLSRMLSSAPSSPRLGVSWRDQRSELGVAEWAFGPRRAQCAAVPADRSRVAVFSARSSAPVRWLEHRQMASQGKGGIRSLCWSPFSGNLLVVGLTGKLQLWQLQSFESDVREVFQQKRMTLLPFPAAAAKAAACALAWHPKGRWVICALGRTKSAAVVDVYAGGCTLLPLSQAIPEHLASDTMRFTPGGEHAVLALPSGDIIVWETSSWRRKDWTLMSPCLSLDSDPCLLRGCWLCIGPNESRRVGAADDPSHEPDDDGGPASSSQSYPAGLDFRLPVYVVQVSHPAPMIDVRIRSLFLLPQAIRTDEQPGSPGRLLRDRFQGTQTQLLARQLRFDPSGCLLAISGVFLPSEIEELVAQQYFELDKDEALPLPALEQVVLLLSVQSTPRLHCTLLEVYSPPDGGQRNTFGGNAVIKAAIPPEEAKQLTPQKREEIEAEVRNELRQVAAKCAPRICFTSKDDGAAVETGDRPTRRTRQPNVAQLSVGWADTGGLHFYDVAL